MSLLNITIPVFNEETVLEKNILELIDFCYKNLNDNWFIVIANNASTDKTLKIAEKLSQQNTTLIKILNLPKKGKGLAIKTAWQKFPADYYIFMDADLATNLSALPIMIEKLKQNNNIVIGSRKLKQSKIKRSIIRRLVSLIYITFVRYLLNLKLTDFACGFKGIDKKVLNQIITQTINQEWFFDTEMLYLAHKNELKIKEIPVQWTETPNLKRKNNLNIFSVSLKYLKAILKLRITSR